MTTKIDLNSMPLRDLVKLQAELAVLIPRKRDADRADLLATMAQTAAAHGLKLGDLFGSKAARNMRSAHAAPKRRAGHWRKLKVAKFVNRKNASETWTGRGRRPVWLANAIKRGASLQEFAA